MPHRLLLMDDSVTIQRVIELTFAGEDVQVVAVGDGRAAMERIAADPPDVVLADVGTADPDGYEVSAFVKNDPSLAHIPVLLLSGAFQQIDEDRARASGCDGVLAKPFDPREVVVRVREVLDGGQAAGGGDGLLAFLERLLAEDQEEEPGAQHGTAAALPLLQPEPAAACALPLDAPMPVSLDDYFDLIDEVVEAPISRTRCPAPSTSVIVHSM